MDFCEREELGMIFWMEDEMAAVNLRSLEYLSFKRKFEDLKSSETLKAWI